MEVYATPTVPAGRAVVVIERGPEQLVQTAIARVSSVVAWYPAASVAFTVTLYDPAVAGVPEIVPELLASESPEGNWPDAMDQAYGVTPPVAATVAV